MAGSLDGKAQPLNPDAVQSVAVALAAIVAVSLALSQALGGLLTYLTEAIKSTGKVPDGYAGVVALVLGVILGATLGVLANSMATQSYGWGTMLGLGAFAGAIVAAGAVKSYKAMGDVNTGAVAPARTDLATLTDLEGTAQSVLKVASADANNAAALHSNAMANTFYAALPTSSPGEIDAAVGFHKEVLAAKAQADASVGPS